MWQDLSSGPPGFFRNLAFRRSIQHLLLGEPHLSVLDVGAGSGILSLYAAKAKGTKGGGGVVLACEANPVLAALAEEATHQERLIKVVPKLSLDLTTEDLPGGGFDVLVTETFDSGLLGEHCLDIVDHAWKRLLRPGSRIIPSGAKASFFLMQCDRLRAKRAFNGCSVGRLSSERIFLVSKECEEQPYDCEELLDGDFIRLSEDVPLVEVDFADVPLISRLRTSGIVRSCLVRSLCRGTVHAVALWFKLKLDEREILSTRPGAEGGESCRWQQAVFHLEAEIQVQEGEELEVEFKVNGHIALLRCDRKSSPYQCGDRKRLKVPEKLVQRANDENLLVEYAKIGDAVASAGNSMKVLDCCDNDVLLSLHLLKASEKSEVSFLFSSPSSYGWKTEFLFGLGEENGFLRPQERIQGEFPASVRESDGFEYDLLVWSPMSWDGVLEVTDETRLCLSKAGAKGTCTLLPSSITVWCRLFRSDRLKRRFRADPDDPSTSEFDGRLARSLNSLAPSRLKDIDMERDLLVQASEFVSGPTIAAALDATDLLRDFKCDFDLVDLAEGRMADGIVYWCDLSFMDVVLSTWTPDNKFQSYRQAAFLFTQTLPTEKIGRGCFRIESGLVEIDVIRKL